MKFIPRKAQAEILTYESGTLGVSAVPGSGKTHTLAMLAAKLAETIIRLYSNSFVPGTEPVVLVVTFSNSAVNNFKARIAGLMSERGLVPGVGYEVRTLHSMAADIVRVGGANLGLDPEATIIDALTSSYILEKIIDRLPTARLREAFEAVRSDSMKESYLEQVFQDSWKDKVLSICQNTIKRAKDLGISERRLHDALAEAEGDEPGNYRLLSLAADVYTEYQAKLAAYPGLDYEDLMTYAYRILSSDGVSLKRAQERWPFILEDEAQDSSAIQENVLRLLVGERGNWVRVGDPNQAINVSFTTSNPAYLKNFLEEADRTVDLDCSGRSTKSILRCANRLIRWTIEDHPLPMMRAALTEPYIHLTPQNDSSPNPRDEPLRVVFDPKGYTADQEVTVIGNLAVRHAQLYPDETIAILAPTNDRGVRFSDYLRSGEIEVVEFLQSSPQDRDAGKILSTIFKWLARPRVMKNEFLDVVKVLLDRPRELDFYLTEPEREQVFRILTQFRQEKVVDFFYPASEDDFETRLRSIGGDEIVFQTIVRIRELARKWLEARGIRIDQLVLLIAQDVFVDPVDLSIANRLAGVVLRATQADPFANFDTMAEQIIEASKRPEVVAGQGGDEGEFDPGLYRGKIVVTTYHKAKGLEWDQVYLTSLNNYDFPIGKGYKENGYTEFYRSEVYYARGRLDLQSETIEQMVCLCSEPPRTYLEGEATRRSADAYAAERLRLLYVGITRAKKGLYGSRNLGKMRTPMCEAVAVRALRESFGGAGREEKAK
mgnify:FL=1